MTKNIISYKMKSSQSVEFADKGKIDVDSITQIISHSQICSTELGKEIIKNIKDIIGPQEIEWIARNGAELLVDYIVHRYKFKNYPRLKRLESFPLYLLIEPVSFCNLRCPMCFQSDGTFCTDNYRGMIEPDFFEKIVDEAVKEGCKALTLASRGEPTLHKQFGRLIKYCSGKFFELKINTNGTVLNEKMAYEILNAGVDIVTFSVDSYYKQEYEKIRIGANFEKVYENIMRFCNIKKANSKYNKTATRISGVYLGDGQSKEKTIEFWENIVDTVTFTDVVPRWDTYNNTPMNFDKPCTMLWERMYVWFDGTCNPCDFDYKSKLSVGNAKETSLKDIWLGPVYNKYRNMLINGKRSNMYPCDRCNVY